jgi:hypothetical protein
MFKKLLVLIPLLFVLGCEDNIADEPESIMKLWLNGEEVDVEANYEKITTYGEEVEYQGYDSSVTFIKKILVIHFQKEGGRVELNKEHYAVVFTDWEGDTSNGQPIDVGSYQWPSVCPVCPRACMHGESSKWVRMEIIGDSDVAVGGEAHIDEISKSGGTWIISGEGEGTFYNPYIDDNMSGKIEFENLKIETDSEESPYHNYGGR